jgi:DNA-binding response OmpR family regulator
MISPIILVADSDPKNLQILKENLEAAGFQVITVADGTKAWDEIRDHEYNLILSEVNLPGLNGFQLLEKLQADPNTSHLPLIFLTNQREVQQRVRAFQLGAKDYLVKPLHVKEVIAHIRMIQRRLEKTNGEQLNSYTKFSGRLEDIDVPTLIENISIERKTGILTLNNGITNITGQIYFRDGIIINANSGEIRLENAIYEMLLWKKGDFNMVLKEVEVADEISVSNLGLLLEGIRKMDQREKIYKKFPSSNVVFRITSNFLKIIEKKSLPEDVRKFISIIDGKRNLSQIIKDSCYDEAKTMERLYRLHQQGFIKSISRAKETAIVQTEAVQEKSLLPLIDEPIPPVITKLSEPPLPPATLIDDLRPIKLRIEEQRKELILPENGKNNASLLHSSQVIKEPEPKKEPVLSTTKIPAKPLPTPLEPDHLKEPLFNRNEFVRKQNSDNGSQIAVPETLPLQTTMMGDKNQILSIGFDEDNLDEILDVMTGNNFQTKKFEAIGDLAIHFGKISVEQYNHITLLGIFVNSPIHNVIRALIKKLIGTIFVVDSNQKDYEYIGYVIHSIYDNFKLPYIVAVTNFSDHDSMTIESLRYKLNLAPKIPIIFWNENDSSIHQKIIMSLYSVNRIEIENQLEKSSVIMEEAAI